ncbi:hypothetical protein CVT24_009951 [Panaeolus cyanescens]|uniref:DUF676 domain-containing protein n=1 Tax=Panaeolus cyanescens TaxID=181874 RepID=A0A409W3X4_9AGAR|nr:hypothetical protein CVT24_009951 [Panaeolus cyanescens]
MNSVYFPAHVVVIIRRLVNVVSTLSISNQYILHRQAQQAQHNTSDQATAQGHDTSSTSSRKQSLSDFNSSEWPWRYLKNNWDRVILATDKLDALRDIRRSPDETKSSSVVKTTLNLPNWLPGNWSWPNMFSSFQPDFNMPTPEDNPPPPMPPKRPRRDETRKRSRKPLLEDPWESPKYQQDVKPLEPDPIHQLLLNPTLFDPIRTPRYPIVLCHGLYGFDARGPASFPSMRMHYWSNVLRVLRGKVGAEVIVTSVPGTGSITSRANKLDEQLQLRARGRGINFLAHSMGGLDCRHLISHIRPAEYAPLSLTSICTPHRGSPFMDWCSSNIGIGKLREQEKELTEELRRSRRRTNGRLVSAISDEDDYLYSPSELEQQSTPAGRTAKSESSAFSLSLSSLPSSFTTLLLSIVDSPAYANLTSHYLNNVFNPATPDDPRVKYWSVASRVSREQVSIWHPFWLPKMVLDGVEEAEREKRRKEWVKKTGRVNNGDKDRWVGEETPMWANEREWGNDGLVTVQSAKWGEFLGIMEGCDHWEMRGARGIEFGVDLPAIPAIGLGTPYAEPSSNPRSQTTTTGGDGWGFGDWTKFVGAWRKSKKDENDRAGSVHKHHNHDQEVQKIHEELMSNAPAKLSSTPDTYVAPSVPESSSPVVEAANIPSSSTVSSVTASNDTTSSSNMPQKSVKEQEADDLLRASTEKLSVVFDWLIDIVPSPSLINNNTKDRGKQKEVEMMKAISKAAVERTAGGGAYISSSATPATSSSAMETSAPPPSSPASPMKRRMDREDRGRRKNELGDRADLERFYVALARKMYDAGL